MSIKDRNLSAGTKLIARYKDTAYAAEVVQTDEGLRYRLKDGREFKSPSGAGRAVMDGKACNGWAFWSLADEASEASNQTAEAKPPRQTGAKRSKKGTSMKPPSEAGSTSA